MRALRGAPAQKSGLGELLGGMLQTTLNLQSGADFTSQFIADSQLSQSLITRA